LKQQFDEVYVVKKKFESKKKKLKENQKKFRKIVA